MIIKSVTANRITSSQGDETVEAVIEFTDGTKSSASVPAGISAGKYEVKKVPVVDALTEIGKINDLVKDKDWTASSLDNLLANKEFGGNSTLAVSAAFWRVQAEVKQKMAEPNKRFPKLMLLVFEGGRHGSPNISMQEFMAIEDSYVQAAKDFRTVREYLEANNIDKSIGSEGAFSPSSYNNVAVLEAIKKALPQAKVALDVAAAFNAGEFIDYSSLTYYYNLVSIEDPYSEEDWDMWSALLNLLGKDFQIVGDDLTASNPERIKMAARKKAINAVVIKPNQIGTISGALQAVKTARENNFKVVVSHRGEETNDNWIVDFALFVEADFVKFGGLERQERAAKYNRLMELGMK